METPKLYFIITLQTSKDYMLVKTRLFSYILTNKINTMVRVYH